MLHNTIAQRQFCEYFPSSRPTSLFWWGQVELGGLFSMFSMSEQSLTEYDSWETSLFRQSIALLHILTTKLTTTRWKQERISRKRHGGNCPKTPSCRPTNYLTNLFRLYFATNIYIFIHHNYGSTKKKQKNKQIYNKKLKKREHYTT